MSRAPQRHDGTGQPARRLHLVVMRSLEIASYAQSNTKLLKLPPAKRPKAVFVVDRLPKSDRGKVLRDKLREEWALRVKAPA